MFPVSFPVSGPPRFIACLAPLSSRCAANRSCPCPAPNHASSPNNPFRPPLRQLCCAVLCCALPCFYFSLFLVLLPIEVGKYPVRTHAPRLFSLLPASVSSILPSNLHFSLTFILRQEHSFSSLVVGCMFCCSVLSIVLCVLALRIHRKLRSANHHHNHHTSQLFGNDLTTTS